MCGEMWVLQPGEVNGQLPLNHWPVNCKGNIDPTLWLRNHKFYHFLFTCQAGKYAIVA